jgi:hypothetical protein
MKYITAVLIILFITVFSVKSQEPTYSDSLLYYKQKVDSLEKELAEVKQLKWKLRDFSKEESHSSFHFKLTSVLVIICIALLAIAVIFFMLFLHYRKIVQSSKGK